jgi:hypothetical protein
MWIVSRALYFFGASAGFSVGRPALGAPSESFRRSTAPAWHPCVEQPFRFPARSRPCSDSLGKLSQHLCQMWQFAAVMPDHSLAQTAAPTPTATQSEDKRIFWIIPN